MLSLIGLDDASVRVSCSWSRVSWVVVVAEELTFTLIDGFGFEDDYSNPSVGNLSDVRLEGTLAFAVCSAAAPF